MSNPAHDLYGQDGRIPSNFVFQVIDNSELLNESYSLRYEVYCNERHFLSAADYPNHLEIDEYDPYSIHIGGTNKLPEKLMVATVRLVLPSLLGLPLLDHCQIHPEYKHLASQ